MGRIDEATKQRILDTADIVEVVSDYVQLKRRGANYVGLCPFHNERTPSFSVSKSKGYCKCFSCGKGGSAVGFLMEIEQVSYNEALRLLAKKYGIEIKERELTAEEREAETERESMLAVNDFAMRYFEQVLTDTDDGRNIGLAYFRERGINDAMIQRFHLGYSLAERDALWKAATSKGFNEKFLISTGLCYKNDRGQAIDKFRGRVIYPVHTLSGKVIAFGGRTLRTDKEVAKYVNSPESIIYKKSNELYGLYQAKPSIAKKDKCILVEGYMDVISMHQSGVENVVASSGTSLTEGQIRLIHRFTSNVTVIYDSDAAGIKASLRGIDMLLAEGMNVKVLLLPDGDDPDSFAQSHTSSEVEQYIADHEQDFIAFKTKILLDGVGNDPNARSRAINDIVRSVAMIPDNITRAVYVGECSRQLGIDEKTLSLQVAKYAAEKAEHDNIEKQRRDNRIAAGLPPTPGEESQQANLQLVAGSTSDSTVTQPEAHSTQGLEKIMYPYERDLLRYVVRYGMCVVSSVQVVGSSEFGDLTVLEYINQELQFDNISFLNPSLRTTFDAANALNDSTWHDARSNFLAEAHQRMETKIAQGIEHLRMTMDDIGKIEKQEIALREAAEQEMQVEIRDFCSDYISKRLISHPDEVVRRVATDLVSDKHQLSRIHSRFSKVATEHDRLYELVQMAIENIKEAVLECQIQDINRSIKEAYAMENPDFDQIRQLMLENKRLNNLKKELAQYLGDRIISPRKK